jgi:hypothetical protein
MLCALMPADKAPVWLVRAQYNLTSSPAVDARGNIYFVGGLYLYAVQPPDGAMPAKKSSWPQFRANPRHTGRVDD